MRQLAAILRKELKDTLRDRRSLFAALLLPVMVGALTFVIFGSRALADHLSSTTGRTR
jgi:ABC-type Na+ efflux pump permease subunit